MDGIVYLCKNIEVLELSRLFLNTERIAVRRFGDILSASILVKDLGSLQRQQRQENRKDGLT